MVDLISTHESWIVSSMSVLSLFFFFSLAILVSRIVHDSDSHSLERKSPKLNIYFIAATPLKQYFSENRMKR